MLRRNGSRLVALYGFPGSGKDTVAGMMDGWTRVAFADPVREMVLALDPVVGHWNDGSYIHLSKLIPGRGIEGCKREFPEVRRLLQRMGTEAGRKVLGEDVWVRAAEGKIVDVLDNGGKVVLTDMRFVNEYDLVRDMGGTVVQVVRRGCEGMNHESEKHYGEFAPDYVIENNGSIDLLRESVETLLTCLLTL